MSPGIASVPERAHELKVLLNGEARLCSAVAGSRHTR